MEISCNHHPNELGARSSYRYSFTFSLIHSHQWFLSQTKSLLEAPSTYFFLERTEYPHESSVFGSLESSSLKVFLQLSSIQNLNTVHLLQSLREESTMCFLRGDSHLKGVRVIGWKTIPSLHRRFTHWIANIVNLRRNDGIILEVLREISRVDVTMYLRCSMEGYCSLLDALIRVWSNRPIVSHWREQNDESG